MNFTEDLNNASSPQFKSLAQDIEHGVLGAIKSSFPSVEAVEVYDFQEGSVIAKYYIITDPDTAPLDAGNMQTVLQRAISSGSISDLNVDTSYVPVVQSK